MGAGLGAAMGAGMGAAMGAGMGAGPGAGPGGPGVDQGAGPGIGNIRPWGNNPPPQPPRRVGNIPPDAEVEDQCSCNLIVNQTYPNRPYLQKNQINLSQNGEIGTAFAEQYESFYVVNLDATCSCPKHGKGKIKWDCPDAIGYGGTPSGGDKFFAFRNPGKYTEIGRAHV